MGEEMSIFRIMSGKIILSIFLGCVVAAIVFVALLLLCVALGLFGWADGGDPQFLRRLELTTMASLYCSMFLGAAIGAYVTHQISKTKYAHLITAVVLFTCLFILSASDFSDLFPYLSVIVGCIVGGFFSVKNKRI